MNEDKHDATGDWIEGYIRYMMNEHVFIPLCLLLSLAAQTDRSLAWEKAKESLHLGSIVAMEWTSNEKVSIGGIMPNTRCFPDVQGFQVDCWASLIKNCVGRHTLKRTVKLEIVYILLLHNYELCCCMTCSPEDLWRGSLTRFIYFTTQ